MQTAMNSPLHFSLGRKADGPRPAAEIELTQPSHGFARKNFSPLVFGDSDPAARLGDAIAA